MRLRPHALLATWLAAFRGGASAVETSFRHVFEYEPAQEAVALDERLVRWNTHSVVPAFGMEPGARLELEVSSVAVRQPDANATSHAPVVFSLYDHDQWRAYSILRLRDVPLRSVSVLCQYPSAVRFTVPPAPSSVGAEPPPPWTLVFEVRKASRYTLQVQVCGDASVAIAGRARMVNVGADGQLSEHLGVEELGLRPLYKVLAAMYAVGTLLWVLECHVWARNVPRISYVFQAVLHAKLLAVGLNMAFYSERSARGRVGGLLEAAQSMGESVTSAALLGTAVLGALGWSITQTSLSPRERGVLLVLGSVYATLVVGRTTCHPPEAERCRAYTLAEYALQSMLMLGVVVALNFTLGQLQLAVTQERWNCFATPLTYMKLDQFQRFRVVFLAYLLLPTFLLVLDLVVISPPGSWRYMWVNTLLSEIATLVVLVNLGLVMRPLDADVYSRIARNTDPRNANHAIGEASASAGRRDAVVPVRQAASAIGASPRRSTGTVTMEGT